MFRRLVLLALLCFAAQPAARAAVVANLTQANFEAAIAEGGLVTFANGGTLTLTNPVRVLKNTVVDATSVGGVTLAGGATNRLLYVTNGVSLSLRSVSLRNGRATFGGALWNDGGNVSIRGAVISGNQANGTAGITATNAGAAGTSGSAAFGGAIFNGGFLALTNVAFDANSANGGDGGNGATGPIVNSFGRSGGDGGHGAAAWGGAIYSTGAITCELVSFAGNAAKAGNPGTGGPVALGSLGIAGGAIDGMGGFAANAYGGAIYTTGPLAMTNVTFSGNSATASAGGIGSQGTGSTAGQTGRNGGEAIGGAVHAGGGFTALNTTFAGNSAVGGAGGRGGNTSSSGIPRAGAGGNGGDAIGGALFTLGNGLVRYTTWATNSAIAGTNGLAGSGAAPTRPGVPGTAKGGSLANSNLLGNVSLNSSLLGDAFPHNAWGAVTDGGHNLSSDASVTWTQASSRNSLPLFLQPIQQNNGVVLTVGFATNSPALDAGDPATMPPTDARQVVRPVFGGPDIGAFELDRVFFLYGLLSEVYSVGSTNFTNVVVNFPVWANNVRAVTGTNGVYVFTNLLAGTYTVAPTNWGAGFTPLLRIVSLGETNAANPTGLATNVNFLANRPTLRIAGFPRLVETNRVTATNNSVVTTNTVVSTNGNFLAVTNFALPSRTYRLQSITNLGTTNWINLATNTTGPVGSGTFIITNFPGGERRFFRVLAP